MTALRIVVLVGSLRRDSLNRRLARGLETVAPTGTAFTHLDIGDLPLYNEDDGPLNRVEDLKQTVRAADGLLFVSPEYNRSIPGVLKNAIDHLSRPMRENAWAGKPAGVIGLSPGRLGTSMMQQHLRNVLAVLDVRVMASPEAYVSGGEAIFAEDGGFSADHRDFLQRWMDAYLGWVRQLSRRA